MTETEQQKAWGKESIELWEKIYVGKKDSNGNTITRIHGKYSEYAIYDTVSNVSPIDNMSFFIRGTTKDRDVELEKKFYDIQDEFSKFKAILPKINPDQSYRGRVANVISLALTDNLTATEANKKIEDITSDAINEYQLVLKGRSQYWNGAIFFAFLIALVGVYFYLHRVSSFIPANQSLNIFVYTSVFSSIGGLLSIYYKLKELLIEKDLCKPIPLCFHKPISSCLCNPATPCEFNLINLTYGFYGAQRLLISILAGIVAIVFVKAGLLISGNDNIYSLMAICIVAGFSETLIPNVLKKLDKDTTDV